METTPTLPIENHLFLFLSRFGLAGDELLPRIEQLTCQHESININKICELALENGTAGFLYKNINGLNLFPEPAEDDLRTWYSHYLTHNTRLLDETQRLLAVFSANGIPVIPLKGTIASKILFQDLGVYPSGDIDLLVRPSDLAKTKDILCHHCGYTQTEEIDEKDLIASHYHLMLQKNDILCEVHWNCVKRYFNVPPTFWWKDTREVVLPDGSIVLQLGTEKYLLYLIFRLFDHCFYPLRFFVLIDGLVSKYSAEISWEQLMDYAAQLQMRRLTIFVLCLLHEIHGSDIPTNLVNNKMIGHSILRRLVYSGIFSGADRPHLRMAAYSLLLDSPVAFLRILLGRIAPSPAELRLRYNIPVASPLIFFYYVVNPFMMFLKRKKS